jgi:hypothetical protein
VASIDAHFSAEHAHALGHAEQTQTSPGSGTGIEADAVILNEKVQFVIDFFHPNIDMGSVRVAGNVGERLLDEPENGNGSIFIQFVFVPIRMKNAVNATAFPELLDDVLKRGAQAKHVEHARAQTFGDAPHGFDGAFHESARAVNAICAGFVAAGIAGASMILAQPAEVDT